ncbi:MAG TPA: hypothetical protein VM840_03590 [Actinomycetota bacterium]|nr:hypothetical protein [Actinomycetota bacterium]
MLARLADESRANLSEVAEVVNRLVVPVVRREVALRRTAERILAGIPSPRPLAGRERVDAVAVVVAAPAGEDMLRVEPGGGSRQPAYRRPNVAQ